MVKHSTKSPPRRLHGQGSVRKRADGRWEVRLTSFVDGQRQRKSFYFGRSEDALSFLRTATTPEARMSWNIHPRQANRSHCAVGYTPGWKRKKTGSRLLPGAIMRASFAVI